MKKFFVVAIAMTMVSLSLFAAKTTTPIKGKIIEKQTHEPLAYATVSIHRADSTIVTGATTDENGNFSIENVPAGNYTLKVTFIGYKEYNTAVTIPNEINVNDIGTIEIEEDAETLKTAIITEKVPVIEQKLDKLVMNVAEAVSTQGSNGLEILKKAPGVSVDPDGNIMLNGSVVDVWIDGRPSYMSGKELEAILLSTDGTTIDKIEIIAHPSSKYDASGSGGIINIKTKKNFMKGFNGSVSGSYGGMYFDRYNQMISGTANLAYRTDKTNTFFTYSPSYDENMSHFNTEMLFGDDYSMNQKSHTDYLSKSMMHSFKLGNDFFINKKNIFGVIVTSLISESEQYNYNDSFTDTYLNNNILFSQKSDIGYEGFNDNIRVNLNYTHIFDEAKGQELTANVDYGYYDILDLSNQENLFVDPLTKAELPDPNVFRSNALQNISMLSAKVDYQQLFWQTGQFEAGLKWVMTNTDNNTLREDYLVDTWTKNNKLSNVFGYNEQIAAAYVNAAKMFGTKWVAKVGLRAEYTFSKGDWISSGTSSTKNYLNLFPTAYLGYTPSQNWRYSLSYTRRLNRPSFNQLNPFRAYIDANSSLQGNPNLDPQYTHQLAATVGVKSFLNLTFLFQRTTKMIMQAPYIEDATGNKLLIYENFGDQNMFGGVASLTEIPIFKWMVFNASVALLKITNDSSADSYQSEGLMKQGYGNLTFILPKDWKIELGGFMQGGFPYGYFILEPQYQFFGGIKKNLMENKATLALNVSDIFRTSQSIVKLADEKGFEYYNLDQSFDTQMVKLSFTYRFGQSKATRRRNVGTFEDSERVGSSGSGMNASTGATTGLE